MSTQRFSTLVPSSHQRMAAGALALLLALAGGPSFAAERASSQTPPQPVHGVASQDVSASRINGREDWDVDYPSQLAPQTLRPQARPVREAGADSTVTSPVIEHAAEVHVPAA